MRWWPFIEKNKTHSQWRNPNSTGSVITFRTGYNLVHHFIRLSTDCSALSVCDAESRKRKKRSKINKNKKFNVLMTFSIFFCFTRITVKKITLVRYFNAKKLLWKKTNLVWSQSFILRNFSDVSIHAPKIVYRRRLVSWLLLLSSPTFFFVCLSLRF